MDINQTIEDFHNKIVVMQTIIRESKILAKQLVLLYGKIEIPFDEETDNNNTHTEFMYWNKHSEESKAILIGIGMEGQEVFFIGREGDSTVEVLIDQVNGDDLVYLVRDLLNYVQSKEQP